MGDWTGTIPTILAGDIVDGDEWKTVLDVETALTGAWTDYSTYFGANLSAPTPPTIGNSTVSAKYTRIGKTLEIAFSIIIGSTFAVGVGTYDFPIPSGMTWSSHRRVIGSLYVLDSGTADRFGGTIIGRSTGLAFQAGIGTAFVGAASPQVWAAGDEIRGYVRGEIS